MAASKIAGRDSMTSLGSKAVGLQAAAQDTADSLKAIRKLLKTNQLGIPEGL